MDEQNDTVYGPSATTSESGREAAPTSLQLGLWAPTLTEQGFGPYLGDDLAHFEADDMAISRLHVRGLITTSQHIAARGRLGKKIARALRAKIAGPVSDGATPRPLAEQPTRPGTNHNNV